MRRVLIMVTIVAMTAVPVGVLQSQGNDDKNAPKVREPRTEIELAAKYRQLRAQPRVFNQGWHQGLSTGRTSRHGQPSWIRMVDRCIERAMRHLDLAAPPASDTRDVEAAVYKAAERCYRHAPGGAKGIANATGSPVDVIIY